MKHIPSTKPAAKSGTLALSLALLSSVAYGDAVFDFNDGTSLDGAGVGGTMSANDLAVSTLVTLTTVDIIGQDGSMASDGINLHETNVAGSNNALGINDFTNPGGFSNETRDFNAGQAWIFKFDLDVELVEIDFSGWGDTSSEITLSFSDGTTADIVLSGDVPGDTFSLGNTLITAGTEITMGLTNTSGDQAIRVPYLTVSAIPPVSTADNLVWAGGDGGAWNTVDANFTGDDTVFATGDNVEIQTAGAINIDGGGITAGVLTDTTATGTVTLQTGDLTSSSLAKSGADTLVIASPVALDVSGGLTTLSGGTLQVSDGASLTTNALTLSGGATLQIDAGGTLTVSGSGAFDSGGATLRNEESVSLGIMSNGVVDVPFTKTGSGILTLTGELGAQNTGPVDLDILGGSVAATGNNQLNIGGTNVWDGNLTLDAADLEFHGSTVSGTGSIIAQSGSATINSRFNAGAVNIANTVVLDSDLTVDAPTGDSVLNLNGVISGPANLQKAGNGSVVLTADNTYLGTTTINNNGTLFIGAGAGSTSGSLGAGDVIFIDPDATLQFQRDDAIAVSNLISGDGNVTQLGGPTSSTTLSGLNTYTGVTAIRGGTLVATTLADYGSPSSIGAGNLAGTLAPEQYLLIREGGILAYTGPATTTDREFTLGGTGGGSILNNGTGALEFTSDLPIGSDGTGTALRSLTLGGSAPGVSSIAMEIPDGDGDGFDPAPRGITKTGTTTWALTNPANSYTGPTTVEEGTLSLGSDFLADLSTVSIASGAVLDLPHGMGDTVDALFLDGVQVAAGTYGSSSVTAVTLDVVDDTHFSGDGYLIVTTSPVVNDYDTWAGASGFNLTGGPTDDDDHDGLTNEEEYAFGLNPTSAGSVSPVTAPDSGTFTYTRRNPAVHATGLTYTYGWSTTLQGAFTPFASDPVETTDGGDPVETVTVSIPAALLANPGLFLQVTAQ